MFGRFFSAYLNNQTQSVTLFHPRTSFDDATGVELTVSGLTLQADLEGISTQLIRRVEVLEFGIDFDPSPTKRVFVSGRLAVLFELPSNIQMNFTALTTSIDYAMTFTNGTLIGRMRLKDLPVEHNQLSNELLMSFQRGELVVFNELAFREFAAKLVLTSEVDVAIEGVALALAAVPIGHLTLSDLPVSDTLRLAGYDRFDHGRLTIKQVDITNAVSADTLALRVETQIQNPSVVHILHGGRLTLDLRDANTGLSLGSVVIDPFVLQTKDNLTILNAQGTFRITAENDQIARQFISQMVSGRDNDVELHGRSTDDSISLLSLAIGDLRMRAAVPGLSGDRSLVRELVLKKLSNIQISGIPFGLVKTLSTRIRLVNPFGTSLTIVGMNIRADFSAQVSESLQVGTVSDNSTINIGPYEALLTRYIDVKITAKLPTMLALVTPLLAGAFRLSLSGSIDVIIGNQLVLRQLPLTLLNVSSVQEASL